MTSGPAPSPIARRPGEQRALAMAFVCFFLLLCSYYLLRPLREAMGAQAGLANLKWLFTATLGSMLVLTPLFGALVARVRKRLLLPVTNAFFVGNLLLFYAAFTADPASVWTARVFFVWLSVFNYFVVSVFWSFMVDVFSSEQARRLFGPIAAGGSAGAIVGPLLAQGLVAPLGVAGLVLLSAGLLAGTIACIRWLGHWSESQGAKAAHPGESDRSIGGGALAGLLLTARSPYLLGICAIVALASVAGTLMYFELQRLVTAQYADTITRTEFFARLDLAVSLAAIGLQGFATSRLVARFRMTGALVIMPVAAMVSFAWLAAMPLLTVLAATQVVRRAGEFGIGKPCREMLFSTVDAETKYKSKNFIDTVVQRASDTSGAWLHTLLATQGVTLAGFAGTGAALMAVLFFLSLAMARAYELRESPRLSPR
jgi:ATP:ADP antiporter, AAA family